MDIQGPNYFKAIVVIFIGKEIQIKAVLSQDSWYFQSSFDFREKEIFCWLLWKSARDHRNPAYIKL